jgi:hypothetical protein
MNIVNAKWSNDGQLLAVAGYIQSNDKGENLLHVYNSRGEVISNFQLNIYMTIIKTY